MPDKFYCPLFRWGDGCDGKGKGGKEKKVKGDTMKRFESQEANQLLGAPLNEIEGYTYCCDKHYRDMLERRRATSAKPQTRSSVDTNVRPVRPPVEATDKLQYLDQGEHDIAPEVTALTCRWSPGSMLSDGLRSQRAAAAAAEQQGPDGERSLPFESVARNANGLIQA